MTPKRPNAMMMALKHAKKKPKITKEVDELDVSKSSDGGAMALLRNVTLLIKRAEVILEQAQMQESGEDGSSGGEDSSKEADMASWSKQLRLVANGVSVLTRRRQPGSPVTDLPSADERVALTELLRNVETVIEEHETGNLSAESMAKLEFSINSLAIIDIEEGMDSTKVPDWVPEESIDQRLASLSLGNTRQSTLSEAELERSKAIERCFNESDKIIPDIKRDPDNWKSYKRHMASYAERREEYKVGDTKIKAGETEGGEDGVSEGGVTGA